MNQPADVAGVSFSPAACKAKTYGSPPCAVELISEGVPYRVIGLDAAKVTSGVNNCKVKPEMDIQATEERSHAPPDGLQELVHRVLHRLMQQATELHRHGRLAEAQSAYEAVLQEQPRHADANHNLGVIALERDDATVGIEYFRAARDEVPGHWQYWISYLDALTRSGQLWEAVQVLEDARRAGLAPEAVDEVLERLMQAPPTAIRSAAPSASHASASEPTGTDVVALTSLLNQQRYAELELAARDLAGTCPDNPLPWKMLALAQQAQQRQAVEALRRLALLCPEDGSHLNTLGLALVDQARLVEAEFCFRQAIALAARGPLAHCNLGMVLHRRGRLQQAEECLRHCIALYGTFHVAHLNLSVVLDELGRVEEAEMCVRRALQLKPDFAEAYNSLGYLQKDQGQVEQAETSIRRALALDPSNRDAHSNLLFVLNYHPDYPADEIFSAYRAFDAQIGHPLQAQWYAHGNSRTTARRLRVGYVCATFNNHSTRHFLEPLLAQHDHQRVEVVAYAEELVVPDASTQRYQSYCDQWVVTTGMSDDALAQRIRADGIDVLVDIAGHTRGNRLGVFARKPAPVSLHWLDFGATTGLSAIDYYLTDAWSAPPGSEGLFAEAPWRLPVPALVYRPGPGMGAVGSLPALQNGFITFGTLTRAIRINHRTVRVWAEILQRVENARLVIDSGNFKSSSAQKALQEKFVAHGVDPARLVIGCHSPPWDVLRSLDIGLDCFPHNSGTTLFEMLYMGVPYVTLAGRPSVGRLGSAILEGVGRPEWVAESESAYVELAVALARDLPRLISLRARLRADMHASPLMDEPGFARHVEGAYAQMFERWSQSQPHVPGLVGGSADEVAGPAPPAIIGQLTQTALQQSMELALVHHRAGQLDAAQVLYRSILDLSPDHPDANHNLAVITLEGGDARGSLPYFRKAQAAQPGNWQYWLSCFDGLLQAGEYAAATSMLELKRRFGLAVPAMEELIERLVESRFTHESRPSPALSTRVAARMPARPSAPLRKARPEPPPAQVSHIEALFKQERLTEVVALSTGLTRRHPLAAFGWKALGAALVNLGRFVEALPALQKAVDCAPGDAGALSNLGFALQNQRRPVEAEVSLRLALKYRPQFASAVINLGATVLSQDRYEEAAVLYQQGLAIEPGYIPAHSHLAQVLDEQGRLVEAAAGFQKTLDLLAACTEGSTVARMTVTQAYAHQGLCSTFAKLADFERVLSEADKALALLPDDAVLWEKRLYALSYHPDLTAADIFAEFVRWGDRFQVPASDFSGHDRTPGRRLKVAYVSPDFRRHTSRFYFLPFFANHDHAAVEIFAYSNVKVEDEFSARFKELFDHWRDIRECSDEEVAAMVRADGIDILVDGCNHMRDDRLGVFALKPAPIQVTWLGAAWTTGLQAVDYVLFDPHIAPAHTLAREKIVRLPHCFVPFQALVDTDLPAPPPCLKNGYVTFGYSGRTERLNQHTFRVWGEILRRMPTARLVLDFRHFVDPHNRQHFETLMARHGLGPDRVVMRNSSNIFKGLHDFDILLDCFPHSGGTMLVDALWMGVPVLTLAARPPLGRIGTTFVTNIGLPHWVAASEEEYITKACTFAADTEALTALRAGMRARMLASPLMDGPGFARGVEAAYQVMWARFCAGEPASALAVGA